MMGEVSVRETFSVSCCVYLVCQLGFNFIRNVFIASANQALRCVNGRRGIGNRLEKKNVQNKEPKLIVIFAFKNILT